VSHVEYRKEAHVASIVLNRPEKLNAVTPEMAAEIARLADEVDRDRDVRVVVLSGAGDRAFCAGSDVGTLDPEASTWAVRNRELDYSYALRAVRKPLIAMIDGYATGGGLELALVADIRYASERSSFAAPEVRLGWTPGGGASQLLPRLVGYGKAMELMLTGRMIPAAEAAATGLVQRVVADTDLERVTYELAEEIASLSPIAVEAVKQAIRLSLSTPPEVGMHAENELFSICFTSKDAAEGISAFMEKRAPVFRGY
jgi:enoyl-CoA hydratase